MRGATYVITVKNTGAKGAQLTALALEATPFLAPPGSVVEVVGSNRTLHPASMGGLRVATRRQECKGARGHDLRRSVDDACSATAFAG